MIVGRLEPSTDNEGVARVTNRQRDHAGLHHAAELGDADAQYNGPRRASTPRARKAGSAAGRRSSSPTSNRKL